MTTRNAGPPPVQNAEKALTVADQRLGQVVGLMNRDDRVAQFRELLGSERAVARFRTVALHALAQNGAALRQCTPISIVEAIRESAALGLEPTGLLGEGWIIPYGDVARFQPGYRGYLKLLRNTGEVKALDCQLVYLNDKFHVEFGTEPRIMHVPLLFGERDPETGDLMNERGGYRGAYAWVRFHSGELVIEWMPEVDINRVRDAAPSARSKDSPWNNHWGEMARKTAIRRLLKRLPLSAMPKVAAVLRLDEEQDADERPVEVPRLTAGQAAYAAAAEAAVAHTTTTDTNGAHETPTAPTEDTTPTAVAAAIDLAPDPVATSLAVPAPSTANVCGARSPYSDDPDEGACVRAAGHDGNHRGDDKTTWS